MSWLRLTAIMAAILTLSMLATSCGNAKRTKFGRDPTAPLESLKAADFCAADAKGSFDTSNSKVNQGTETPPSGGDSYMFGRGGGCIQRPIREVWAVTHNLDLMLWDGVDHYTASYAPKLPHGVTHFIEIHYVVDSPIGAVKWTMQWYHSVPKGSGSPQAPTRIVINYQRIDGTVHIPYWEGSIILEEIQPAANGKPAITGMVVVNKINADRTSPQDAGDTIRELLDKMRSGDPNWGPIPTLE